MFQKIKTSTTSQSQPALIITVSQSNKIDLRNIIPYLEIHKV